MKFCALGLAALLFTACERKSIPSKPTHTASTEAKETKPAPTVVVNGDGQVVNSSVKTNTGSKVYPVTSARSFTPAQKQNLMTRFKTVPPKVLHVPESLQKKNAKGTYYVYSTKFWYWKKTDGYFYLDENYYN